MHSTCHHPSNDVVHHTFHHKRFSVSKLSSETLPKYSSPPDWSSARVASDQPPDYPETADEAGADTGGGHEEHVVHVHHHLVHPRRSSIHIRRPKRVHAALSDPFLDTLLERSAHALEVSNDLLRTTISAHSSLSALFSSENESDRILEVRARNLSTRMRGGNGVQETWMEHLEEISEGVDRLFGEGRKSHSEEGTVSQSLPTTSVPDLRHRRKPSILELNRSSNSHLRYSHPTRDALIAPAPRALTQYVESTSDPQSISLPSTLGLRAPASSHSVQSGEFFHAHHQVTQPAPTAGMSLETQREGTPAYHLLSNLVKRSRSLSSPSSARLLRFRDGCASASPTGMVRQSDLSLSHSSVPISRSFSSSSQPGTQAHISSSGSEFRTSLFSPSHSHAMPADDEFSSSSESSDSLTGFRAVQSLRKILNEHPSSSSVDTLQRKLRCVPAFLPITPPPAPIQGTSTATASISRLYTKGRHSLSTRPPSPPTHSSLKVRSASPTPSPSPSTMSLSEVFGNGVSRMIGSTPSSGVSTPKRISFAALPESYSGLQSGPSKLRGQKKRKKIKQGKVGDEGEADGWLKTLLHGGLTSGHLAGTGGREERMEERMARGWGSRPGYGTLDEWAV